MIRAFARLILILALSVAGCTSAFAQQTTNADDGGVAPTDQTRQPIRRPTPKDPIGERVFGLVDFEHLWASQSFNAVLGSANFVGYGGGADILNLGGRGLFVRGAVSTMAKSGTRTDTSISNGITVDVHMVPVDVGAGWRFKHVTRGDQFVPFIGGGGVFVHYSETTPSGNPSDNTSSWNGGFEAFGGVDIKITHLFTVAPEVLFRSVPNALGQGGLSKVFGESDLGGIVFRVTAGIHLGR
jgi:hypothetical protein